MRQICGLLVTLLFSETVAEKKYCWYFEGDYPVYFICKTYEDCCGTQCCVRALSIQKIWYFALLLIIGLLCCCSTGYFIRRRVQPYPPSTGPDFSVAFTTNPIISQGNASVCLIPQATFDPETAVGQTRPAHMTAVYYSQPPPSYEQVMQDSQKK